MSGILCIENHMDDDRHILGVTSVTSNLGKYSLKYRQLIILISIKILEFHMQITRQADYAVRAMVYLAQLSPDTRASTGMIAKEKSIPPSFLAKIVSQLSVAGLLQTSRGARGGVSLAKPAETISLLDVIEAIDGPILLNDCVGDSSTCSYDDDCPLKPVWCDAQKMLLDHLSGVNFSQFAQVAAAG
jgi:Rrf2 family protein